MSFRGIWVALIVLLAGCSTAEKKPSEGPERFNAPEDFVNVIGEEPAPVEISSEPHRDATPAPTPAANERRRGFEEENRILGNDPRRAAAEARANASSPSAASRGQVQTNPNAPMAPMAGRVGIMSLLAAARVGVSVSSELASPQDSLLPLISTPRPPMEPRQSSMGLTMSQATLDPEGTRTIADTASPRRWNSAHSKAGCSPRARIRRTTGLKTVPKIMPSIDDVSDFLVANDLGQHIPAFRTNKVDGRVLAKLTDSHLKRLGMHALAHRQTLVRHRELWFDPLEKI